jgi:hypothetical protein
VALSTRHLLALRLRIRVKHEPHSRVFVGIGNRTPKFSHF